MDKVSQIIKFANQIASEMDDFFAKKGPGKGNTSTNAYIKALGNQMETQFGKDYSEKNICGENSSAVDFYFPDEGIVVEIALGLKNPNTEYEKDILKVILAKSLGKNIKKLLFISKPGGEKKCAQPFRLAIRNWLDKEFGIEIEVIDLAP